MKRLTAILAALILLGSVCAVYAEPAAETAEIPRTASISVHLATVEEGQQKMRERTLFHEQLTEYALAFFVQKKGGTVKEYIGYSAEQVIEFTPEDMQRVSNALAWLREKLEQYELLLPDPGEITLVKTTGKEVLGAGGYTSGGTIFLTETIFMPDYYSDSAFRELFVHEIFHCLTRLYPKFRSAMYSLIHFRVLDRDIEIPEKSSAILSPTRMWNIITVVPHSRLKGKRRTAISFF